MYLPLALAALMLGACSSDDLTDAGAAGGNTAGTKGYLNFSINLPSVSGGTRADVSGWTDSFDDGEESEYSVRNARVYLLDSEKKIVQTATPVLDWTGTPSGNNVTLSAQVTVENTADAPAYALVVLNPGSKLPKVTDGSTAFDIFNAALTSCSAADFCTIGEDGVAGNIMMTNAPVVVEKDGQKSVQTLVPIDGTAIKDDAGEAAKQPVTVYVERALAKVSFTQTGAFTDDVYGGKVTINSWIINNTNTTMYPVRKSERLYAASGDGALDLLNDTKWALYGVNRFYGSTENPVRTYFAEDPNYSSISSGDLNFVDSYDASVWKAVDQPSYCLENTFDVANMNEDAATRADFYATYRPDNDAFAGDCDDEKIYTDDHNFFMRGNSTAFYTVKGIARVIADEVNNNASTYGLSVSGTAEVDTMKLSGADAADKLQITADFFPDGSVSEQIPSSGAFAKLSDALAIKCYQGGATYYTAYIKHFGDGLTPFNETDIPYQEDCAGKKWLGRYGVLRNNWYELDVTGIKGPGDPVPPTPGDIPIDSKKQYLSFKVNILSWAKRTQNVTLE